LEAWHQPLRSKKSSSHVSGKATPDFPKVTPYSLSPDTNCRLA
jgi:hypothetical protein